MVRGKELLYRIAEPDSSPPHSSPPPRTPR
jgi:hypothetical protein